MQTLIVNLVGNDHQKQTVPVLIDTGSQKSYVSTKCAVEMGYLPTRQESVRHVLFGGTKSEVVHHDIYHINVSSLTGNFMCNFDVLGQDVICGVVPSAPNGPWIQELAREGIELSDVSGESEIDVLMGSDVCARLWTGERLELSCGLVAMETRLGWTLSGKIPLEARKTSGVSTEVTDLFVREAPMTDLWSLDVLGIQDPTEKMLQADVDRATEEHFLSTVKVNSENRFEVRLPFISNHPPLSENLSSAKKRLMSNVKKLKDQGYLEEYQKVLTGWEEKGIIEKVPPHESEAPAFYLPHHHVVKLGSTTPVRPVFDASARENNKCSLNQCVEKGPNFIEKIPSCLARFRSHQGKNFIGFYNASCKLNWDEIAKYCATRKIEWRFNPPSAPWWGGFWERLIGILIPLLKRVLGNATISCEELLTILSDCEAVINSRPISYMSEEKSDLSFLTPNMFLHDIQESGVPEYDMVHTTDLTKRHKYRQEVVYELRKRFRVEYLGQLQLLSKKSVERTLEVGEMVLIGDENMKRLSWPVGRVEELITSKDNQVRLVKVRTAQGMVVRPVQRIYRLEIAAVPNQSESEMVGPAVGPSQGSPAVVSHEGSLEQIGVPIPQSSQELDLDQTMNSNKDKEGASCFNW
ncbi:hypothetical protein WDU94_010821 [Cyamophila willieti]